MTNIIFKVKSSIWTSENKLLCEVLLVFCGLNQKCNKKQTFQLNRIFVNSVFSNLALIQILLFCLYQYLSLTSIFKFLASFSLKLTSSFSTDIIRKITAGLYWFVL